MEAYRIETKSMTGKLNKNDLIFVKKPNYDSIDVGDIITFETYVVHDSKMVNIVVTHYVAKIDFVDEKKVYYTQDFQNFHAESDFYDTWYDKDKNEVLLDNDNIIGVYIFKIPYIGYAIEFVQSIFKDPIMIILIVSNIAIIFAIIKIGKKMKKDEQRK